ncbi:AaceriAFL059Cp [[Ashbya] aceris (nom. inval.)]|nr:AaceriAFL059Cp [[Ashbya] aceris (nom. inval.)]
MFGAASGGNSLFGGANASTPTPTPAPAGNVFSFNKKPGEGFVGANGNQNNVSTPSPAGDLLGAKSTTTGGLFGQKTEQKPAGGLFGQSSAAPNGTAAGGPFGSTTNSNTQSGGLFGNSTAGGSGGLFGAGSAANNNASSSLGSLFGKPNNAAAPAAGGGLFNNRPSTATTNTVSSTNSLFSNNQGSGAQSNGGLFGAKPTGGLFGNSTSQPQPSLFGTASSQNNQQQQQQTQQQSLLGSNPYGLNLTSVPVTTMPESITAAMTSKKKNELPLVHEKKRMFSTSSTSSVLPLVSNQSTLISKLSSRLNSGKNGESTRGLFSPSRKVLSQGPLVATENTRDLNPSLNHPSSSIPSRPLLSLATRTDMSDMRKLKLDPHRSAAKKLRLLNGQSATTKLKILDTNHQSQREESSEILVSTKIDRQPLEEKRETSSSTGVPESDNECEGYWCSPSIEQLQRLTPQQLSAIPNFVIGRKGYGSISFDLDVDLTAFSDDFRHALFGNVIMFNENKTVEVYPDDSLKPPIGLGLNVPATITLERIYPIDKKTNQPITENSDLAKVQYFVKRLKSMRDMEFISYNPYGGIWTFKVKHFSIWGLVNDSDVEIDDVELEAAREAEIKQRIVAIPKRPGFGKQSENTVPGGFDQLVHIPSSLDIDMTNTSPDEYSVANAPVDALFQDEAMTDLIEEKPYEPSDVDEEDFEGLEAEPNLEVSSDWHQQLQLAADPYKSVFANSTSLNKVNKMDDVIFNTFQKDMDVFKSIRRQRRLDSAPSFVRFNNDSTITMKTDKSASGCTVTASPLPLQTQRNSIDSVLKKSLVDSTIELRRNKYPIVKKFSLTFNDIAAAYKPIPEEHRIWKLASILFDPISIDESRSHIDGAVKDVLVKKKQYELLCDWIINEINSEVESKIVNAGPLEKIFLYLVKRDIIGATTAAIASNNNHLAVLVTLLGSNDPLVRELATSHLSKVKTLGSSLDINILKIYQLLTGSPFGEPANSVISKDLSWLATLGLQIFYGDIDALSLRELIERGLEYSCKDQWPLNDIAANILRLYCSDVTPDILLGNLKISSHNLDVRLSWFFIQILTRADISPSLRDHLTLQYVEQLKFNRMFGEALFIMCFINDDRLAKQQVDHLLSSQITFFSQDSNYELLTRLRIPQSSYYSFLALLDKYNRNHLSEARNLLRAGLFQQAEKVVIVSVAPKLVLDGSTANLQTLRQLLETFPSQEMDTWAHGLGVFEKYLQIALDNNHNQELLSDLVRVLPILAKDFGSHRELSVVCCVMSKRVCHIILEKYQQALETQSFKDRLLALPLGQPETIYLKRALAST